jgi:SAM-dependent methyltransferase
VLALELTFIRQVPAEVRIIAYFTNLLLMAAFFGLGVGCILQRFRVPALLLPLGVLGVAAFVFYARGLVVYEGTQAVHFWAQKPAAMAPALSLPSTASLAFVLCALPFVALGHTLSNAMNGLPRLVGYGWDIAGSLIGTLLFATASGLGLPPWIWPPLILGSWAVIFVNGWASRALHLAAGLSFLIFARGEYAFEWSPYYYVQHKSEERGLRVWVNSSFHQFAIDFSARPEADATRAEFQRTMLRKFSTPYDLYREQHEGKLPGRVLILGAGTGNDVNIALMNGARSIVAVEIDGTIQALGARFNATQPYADPRVRVVIDDARHFLHTAREKFDLIVFGTLDSQTLLSGHANLRLENYVYTREAFADTARRLRPGGLVAAYYSVYKPWLYGRLFQTVCPEFSAHCQVLRTNDALFFNTLVVAANESAMLKTADGQRREFAASISSTDDWPFLYLERPTIAPVYLVLLGLIATLTGAAFLLLRRVERGTAPQLDFFLLGVGFTLMEATAVVRLTLLFGSTWIVSAVVFSAVLCVVFLANLVTLRGWAPKLGLCWCGVVLGAVANALVSTSSLLQYGDVGRGLLAALSIGVPVFFASLCFSRRFSEQGSTGYALGINLVGAMLGGCVEYLSMLIGTRALWLVVVCVYALAWAASRRSGASQVRPAES